MRSYLYYASLSGLTAFYLTYTQALLPGLNYARPSALTLTYIESLTSLRKWSFFGGLSASWFKDRL